MSLATIKDRAFLTYANTYSTVYPATVSSELSNNYRIIIPGIEDYSDLEQKTIQVLFSRSNGDEEATLEIGDFGELPLVKNNAGIYNELSAGDLSSTEPMDIFFTGTEFVLRSGTGLAGSGGGTDYYTVNDTSTENKIILERTSVTQSFSRYEAGMTIQFVPEKFNSGTVMLDVDGLGLRTLLTNTGQQLPANFIEPGLFLEAIYDGASFKAKEQPNEKSTFYEVDIDSTANAIILSRRSETQKYYNYFKGMQISFEPTRDNTGTVTVNADNLGIVGLYTEEGDPLTGGDLTKGIIKNAIYDGVKFTLTNAVGNSNPATQSEVNQGVEPQRTVTPNTLSNTVRRYGKFYGATGTDDYVLTSLDLITISYADGMGATFMVPSSNTGPSTLKIDNLSKKKIKKSNDGGITKVELEYSELKRGVLVTLYFDGEDFLLLPLKGDDNKLEKGLVTGEYDTAEKIENQILSIKSNKLDTGDVSEEYNSGEKIEYKIKGIEAGYLVKGMVSTSYDTAEKIEASIIDLGTRKLEEGGVSVDFNSAKKIEDFILNLNSKKLEVGTATTEYDTAGKIQTKIQALENDKFNSGLVSDDYNTAKKISDKIIALEENTSEKTHNHDTDYAKQSGDYSGLRARSTTKSDVGLSSVQNYGIASQTDAEAGVSDISYMTPLKTRLAIEEYASTEDHNHDELYSKLGHNHDSVYAKMVGTYPQLRAQGTLKDDVGLGKVLNYEMASISDAQTGDVHTKYMSPLRVKEAIEHFASLNTHDHDSVYAKMEGTYGALRAQATTKIDVGLGNVSDFGIANTVEAETGTSNSKYMTPLRVKEAINKFTDAKGHNHDSVYAKLSGTYAGLRAQSTTKTDVGLGSVQNFEISSGSEALAGTSNSKYMTPLRVKESISNFAVPKTGGTFSGEVKFDGAIYIDGWKITVV